jgi:hypothetical protein
VSLQSPLVDQHNLDVGNAVIVRFNAEIDIVLSGLVAGTDGQVKMIYNASANTVTLLQNSASSTAGNRFFVYNAGPYTLAPNSGVTVVYDATSGYWRVF